MKIRHTAKILAAAAVTAAASLNATAALTQWQDAVTAGPATASTHFTTVSTGTQVDVGTLAGDRAFEFVINATSKATPSSALLGTFEDAGGKQALKFDQWNATGNFGVTSFGVEDFYTTVAAPSGVDTHVVFTFNGTKTDLYVNGVFQTTIKSAANGDVALALTGMQGLGGAFNGGAYVDPLQGSILGFASYDSSLSAGDISAHYAAFAAPVPEAGSTALMGLTVMGACLVRRRKS
ncbi:MAG: proteinsorting protein [Verrucomicrobiales bacterium]|nr:proteinsorting protein [Verrucomicrobiales bacterium]